MNLKKMLLLILISSLLNLSCEDSMNEPKYDPNAIRVAGKYSATTFLMPGTGDGTVDIIDIGGTLTVELFLDFSVKGEIKVPPHPDLQGEGFDESFSGDYVVNNDSLQFKNTNNILTNPQLYFDINDNELKGTMEGIAPLIIVLERE